MGGPQSEVQLVTTSELINRWCTQLPLGHQGRELLPHYPPVSPDTASKPTLPCWLINGAHVLITDRWQRQRLDPPAPRSPSSSWPPKSSSTMRASLSPWNSPQSSRRGFGSVFIQELWARSKRIRFDLSGYLQHWGCCTWTRSALQPPHDPTWHKPGVKLGCLNWQTQGTLRSSRRDSLSSHCYLVRWRQQVSGRGSSY